MHTPNRLVILAAAGLLLGTLTAPIALADDHPPIRGSIQVPARKPGAPKWDDRTKAKEYARLAKISRAQAETIAKRAVPGAVTRLELDDEDGSLVYEIRIGNREVLVDAGNGKILRNKPADDD
jgi:hypothetical protein